MTTDLNMTVDHQEIISWVSRRQGAPALTARAQGGQPAGTLLIRFPRHVVPRTNGIKASEISWEEFFERFDRDNLALLYQEQTTSGRLSYFSRLIER
jgi:hypothetical protein